MTGFINHLWTVHDWLAAACHKPEFVDLLCKDKEMFVCGVDGFLSMIRVCELTHSLTVR